MKNLLVTAAFLSAAASGFAQTGLQAGFNLGPTWALAGDSFIVDPVDPTFRLPNTFKDDFDTGWAWGGYVSGPISGMWGWRAEIGRDNMPADADQVSGNIEGDYHLFRFQGGIQLALFESEGKGKPYGFFTLGGVHQDASLDARVGDADLSVDLDGETAFGISFGGGYNYLIGENWGIGADLHVNGGFFDDDTRWWWTPSAQVFFNF